MRHSDSDLEAAGVCGFVSEQQQVEGAIGSLDPGDGGGEGSRCPLRVPVDILDRDQHQVVGTDAGRIAELLLGLGRAEGHHCDLASVRLDDLDGLLDGTLLVGAGGEPQVGCVDGLAVGCDVDPGARSGHTLDADENSHAWVPCSGFTGPTGVSASSASRPDRTRLRWRRPSPDTTRSGTSPAGPCRGRQVRWAGAT